MSSSLAAVFFGTAGQIELQRFAPPVPAADETLVRVLGCTLCGSDLHTIEGRRSTPTPTILGHEIVGRIEAFGDGSRRDSAGQPLQLGDRITWSIVASCGDCFFCQRGLPQKCVKAVKYGHEAFRPGRELLGGLAEHCLLVSGTAIVKLPEQLPLAAACPASCATATVAAALDAAGDLAERSVCILGAGLLGLTAVAMARARGAAAVLCVEVHPARRALATRFGATHAVAPAALAETVSTLPQPAGVDVALELSGAPAAFEAMLPLMRIGGKIILVGSVFPAPPVGLSLEQVVRKHLTLRGIHNYAPQHLLAAVQFLQEHHSRFPFAELVAEWHPLKEIDLALQRARDPNHIRIGIRMDGE